MPTVFEPIGAGIVVALINKFIINNNLICNMCMGSRAEQGKNKTYDEHEEDVSSTSTTTADAIEVHAHF